MPDRHGRRRAVVLAAVAAVAAAGAWNRPARGEGRDQGGDVALAEALFQEGKRLLERGEVAAACPKLAESLRLDEATGTLLALAMCHEAEGRLASAWAEYAGVVARAQTEGRMDRERAARQSVRALEPRLSTLIVEVPEGAAALEGLRVERDGVALAAAGWSTAVPVDPGLHVVAARAPGRTPWSTSLRIGAAAEHLTVTVPVLAPQAPGEASAEGRAPTLAADARAASARADLSTGARPAAPRGPAPVTIALVAGVAADAGSPALGAELAVARAGWGGGLRAAWLASGRQEQVDTEGTVTTQSLALRACGFRRFRAARAVVLEAGPEALLALEREQTTGLGGLPPASRAAWGLGLAGAADLRLARWLSLAVVASADYAPAAWAGTFEVANRGEVLHPAPFRVLVAAGPRFTFDW
ncbi:MAG TPA: hypothetical protein VKZ18_19535 [Polyangia bacterium]|nr:hypothetical protein [Polyangia bacterium]